MADRRFSAIDQMTEEELRRALHKVVELLSKPIRRGYLDPLKLSHLWLGEAKDMIRQLDTRDP